MPIRLPAACGLPLTYRNLSGGMLSRKGKNYIFEALFQGGFAGGEVCRENIGGRGNYYSMYREIFTGFML